MGTFLNMRRRFVFTCRDVNEFLTAYAEGALDEATHQRFELHVSNCLACALYLEQYRETVYLIQESGRRAASAEPPEKLVELTLAFLREHYDEEEAGEGGREES